MPAAGDAWYRAPATAHAAAAGGFRCTAHGHSDARRGIFQPAACALQHTACAHAPSIPAATCYTRHWCTRATSATAALDGQHGAGTCPATRDALRAQASRRSFAFDNSWTVPELWHRSASSRYYANTTPTAGRVRDTRAHRYVTDMVFYCLHWVAPYCTSTTHPHPHHTALPLYHHTPYTTGHIGMPPHPPFRCPHLAYCSHSSPIPLPCRTCGIG